MTHEVYAFGSIVRGDVQSTSDVDILAIPFTENTSKFPATWSIYSPKLLEQYFEEGRLFAWHLHLEARVVYTPNKVDFISKLGEPREYRSAMEDVKDLGQILDDALIGIVNEQNSEIFDYGVMYTALRDIAMSASYVIMDKPNFSRMAPYEIPVEFPLPIETYKKAMLARHCSTRGLDLSLCFEEEKQFLQKSTFKRWLENIEAKL